MSRLNKHTLANNRPKFSSFISFLSICGTEQGHDKPRFWNQTSVASFNSFVLWTMLLKFYEPQYPYLPNVIPP